jgi:hypothetical protein
MECEFCKNIFSSKANLNSHQKTAKYCLEKQGKIESALFKCKHCLKVLSSEKRLKSHYESCNNFSKNTIESRYNERISELQEIIKSKDIQIQDLQNKLENIALKAVSNPSYEEPTIDIFEEDVNEKDKTDDYKLEPLSVGNGYIIENREEDNYINVTNLCKAGGKQFKHWKQIERTKAFLQVLSSTVGISAFELIKQNAGGNGERHTWVHPQVAINIAQWISPAFDVKVSAWVYEVMMTGKVDITNTKSYRQLQEENKDKQLKINYLTKKYVKRIPRTQFEEKNVIYILTTERLKKDNVYILGKASNLTSRLSTYNKSDEHEVVYYQQCLNEDKMAIVENMVFSKLEKYREAANRERFILTENLKVDTFIDTIKECVKFLS